MSCRGMSTEPLTLDWLEQFLWELSFSQGKAPLSAQRLPQVRMRL